MHHSTGNRYRASVFTLWNQPIEVLLIIFFHNSFSVQHILEFPFFISGFLEFIFCYSYYLLLEFQQRIFGLQFSWHFLEILWLFIFLVFYVCRFIIHFLFLFSLYPPTIKDRKVLWLLLACDSQKMERES